MESLEILKKDCFYTALGCISDQCKKCERTHTDIQNLLRTQILNDYMSSCPQMKYRCAWVYSRFAGTQLIPIDITEQILKRTCQLIVDEELPVRYSASLALSRFLNWEVSKVLLSAEIKNLLTIFLKLIEKTDSEEVIESLESIISVFPSQMHPFALELTTILIGNFEKYIQDKKEDNNLPAFSTLNTIAKIVEVVSDDVETLIKLGSALKPSLERMIFLKDYTEEFCNILVVLLFFTPANAMSELYSIFQCMWVAVLGTGSDECLIDPGNTEDIFPCFANFITKFPEKTLENLHFIIPSICKLLHIDEDFMFLACQILLVVFESFRDQLLQQYVPLVLQEINSVFSQDLSKKFKIACSQVVFTMIWNSPVTCAGLYEELRPYLLFVQNNLKYFSEYLAKVHFILGVGSFFTLVDIPGNIQQDLQVFFRLMFETVKECKIDDVNADDSREVHSVELQLNYNKATHDSSSEDEDYEDYPYGIEPVNNFTFNFEAQEPVEAFKKLVEFISSRNELVSVFSTLNPSEQAILTYIIK